MQERKFEKTLFDYTQLSCCSEDFVEFKNCRVNTDFGPFKVGDRVAVVSVSYDSAEIECYVENNTGQLFCAFVGNIFLGVG